MLLTADRRGPGIGDLGPLLLRGPTSPDRGPAQNRGRHPADRHSDGQVDLYREPRTAPRRVSIARFTRTDLLGTGDPANARARSTPILLCGRNIQNLLEQRWSPAQISWHLATEHPDQPAMRVTHEAIHRDLYDSRAGSLDRGSTGCFARNGIDVNPHGLCSGADRDSPGTCR